jgi:hypothetical protein
MVSKDIDRLLEAAKKAAHVGGEMSTWGYAQVVSELKAGVRKLPSSKSRVRDYTREVLKMKGNRYAEVTSWLRGTKVPTNVDDLVTILRALQKSDASSLTPGPTLEPSVRRRTTEHIRTLLNSTVGILPPDGLGEVYESDRMQLRMSMQKLCEAFGVPVVFPEPKTQKEPVTRQDLSKLGVSTHRRKR